MSIWPRGPLFYGWIVIAITFGVVLVTSGVRASPAVYVVPFEQEFGWSRAAIASAVSINLLLYGLAGPISGWLVDRYGPRAVMVGSLSSLALGLAGSLFMKQLWQLQVLWGLVVGLGAGASASVLWATVASRWFILRRGLVLGFLSSANSTGQLIFLPLLMAVIDAFTWRTGTLTMIAIVLLMVMPVLAWMRNDPSEAGLAPYGAGSAAGAAAAKQEAGPGVPLRRAVRTPEFWILAGSFFVCGGTANGLIGTHLIPHSIDHGIAPVAAAATYGVMGGMNFIGSMISGWLIDRVDPRKVLSAVYLLRGSSLFFLPFVSDLPGLVVFAVVYGLDWFASVPPTVALTARRFGKQSMGTIYGWIFASHQLGAAFSATMGGMVRDTFGDYSLAFVAGGILGIIGATLALLVNVNRPAVAPQPAPSRAA